MARKKTDTVAVTLRIREDLRRRLERAAERNDASLNNEMSDRLERSFDSAKTDALLAGLTGSEHSAALLRLIAMTMMVAADWQTNPESAAALRLAISNIADAYIASPTAPKISHIRRMAQILSADEPGMEYGRKLADAVLATVGMASIKGETK